jgi:hypothetical protein
MMLLPLASWPCFQRLPERTDAARRRFKESDLKLIDADTPERIEADRRVIERWRRAQGTTDEEISGHAARAR